MATLTIRNLPEEVHDRLRREAAANRRSMEEEARRALAERYRPRLPPEEIMKRVEELRAKSPPLPPDAKMKLSESVIAGRRIETLYEEGLISVDERKAWDDRIRRLAVSLAEIESFFKTKWPWKPSGS